MYKSDAYFVYTRMFNGNLAPSIYFGDKPSKESIEGKRPIEKLYKIAEEHLHYAEDGNFGMLVTLYPHTE